MYFFFFFSSRRRHTRYWRDWSSDVCSSDLVPVAIPLSWFMMVYPSYVLANFISSGRPTSSGGDSFARIAWLSFLGSMVMAAWDLLVELTSSGPGGAWIWEDSGPYFGVPIHNFAGWMLTTFTVYLAYLLIERRVGLRPIGLVTPLIALMPLLAYASRMVLHTTVGGSASLLESVVDAPAALWVIGPFAMGLPLAAALSRWWDYGTKREALSVATPEVDEHAGQGGRTRARRRIFGASRDGALVRFRP